VRAAGKWVAWCALGAAPIIVPFLVLTPGRLWYDVVVVQSGRPVQAKSLPVRLGAFGLAADLHTTAIGLIAVIIGAVLLAIVLAPLAVAVWRHTGPAAWPDPVWWGVLAAAQLAALAVAPSFYLHYESFVAPALCLLVGAGAGHLVAAAKARGGRTGRSGVAVIVAVAVAAGLGLTVTRPPLPAAGRVDNAELASFAVRHRCLWVRVPAYLQVADATARQFRERCPGSLDLVGSWLVFTAGGKVPGTVASSLDQLEIGQLRGSDGALLEAVSPTQGLGPKSKAYLHAHFAAVGRTGEIQMWSRTS
jgi:hypothetical protein